MQKFKLTRDVTKDECSWLDRTFAAGEIVHKFNGGTYGCIGAGIACSIDGGTPFFELPRDALQLVEKPLHCTTELAMQAGDD
jgi:hypothetical protein